jgi:hypothetical protein
MAEPTEDLTSSTLLKSAYELAREERIKQYVPACQDGGAWPPREPPTRGDRHVSPAPSILLTCMFLLCLVRNEAKLRALGLLAAKDDLAAAVAVPRKEPVKRKKPSVPAQPSRKSRRTQGVAPECAPSAAVGGDDVLFEDTAEGQDEAAAEREAQRLRRYDRLFRRHAEEGLQLPETASYQHTVMRVDTMSEAALSNRVRVIERAAGSYAVIKMKQFAEVSEHTLPMLDAGQLELLLLQELRTLPDWAGAHHGRLRGSRERG